MQKSIVFLCFGLFNLSSCAIYKLNDEEYRLMPPVTRVDPYEDCMRAPGALYCSAYMTLVSDEPSALLTQMKEYSEHTVSHYNHTRLLYGTCMTDTCRAYNASDIRLSIETCWNQTMYEEYKLKVLVEDDVSCVRQGARIHVGAGHITVAAICATLLMFNVVGSLYDLSCKGKTGSVSLLFLCFSIPRNFRKLMSEPGEQDPRQKIFQGFYGMRAILTTQVIIVHSALPAVLFNKNTKFFEEMYEQTWLHLYLNGTVLMQIFLMISAVLLVYNALLISQKHQMNWKILPYAIYMRWLRLTPAYALVLAVTATWLQDIGTGPLWDKIVTIETQDCRRYWWTHLLYINNYFDGSHCMPQTWYLAADTQLYLIGVTVFVLCKSPRVRNAVLSILFLVGVVLPGLHTYFQDLDGTLIVSLSSSFGFFVSDPTFNNVYKRGHTNLACYVLGLVLGYLVYHLQETDFDVSKYKRWRPVYWAVIPLGCTLIMLCKLNYLEGPRANIFYRTAIACIFRPIFGLFTFVFILGMLFKLENFYRGIMEWRGWMCPGRLSYSAYLLHMAFIRTEAGLQTTYISGTYIPVLKTHIFIVTVTYTAAFIFYITVESPLGQLVKTLLGPKKTETGDEKKGEEE